MTVRRKRIRLINFLTYILAFFITVPIIFTILIYIIVRKISRSSKKAVHKSVNYSTIMYIIAVILLVQNIFDKSILGIVLIFMLIVLAILVFFQWKNNMDVQFKKAIKILWKICFLVFMILYVCLIPVGIIMQIVK